MFPIGCKTVEITNNNAYSLEIIPGATACDIHLEALNPADELTVARFWTHGATPQANKGRPLGQGDVLQLFFHTMTHFKIIKINTAKLVLQIEYFRKK